MSLKRVLAGVGAFALGVAAWMPGVAEAATQTTMSIANAAPAVVEQHASIGAPMVIVAGLIGLALRRQRAWYSDPRLAEMLAPLPQDYTYLPPR